LLVSMLFIYYIHDSLYLYCDSYPSLLYSKTAGADPLFQGQTLG
jgi:hypothetical protein